MTYTRTNHRRERTAGIAESQKAGQNCEARQHLLGMLGSGNRLGNG
jgi:hypothetical protein